MSFRNVRANPSLDRPVNDAGKKNMLLPQPVQQPTSIKIADDKRKVGITLNQFLPFIPVDDSALVHGYCSVLKGKASKVCQGKSSLILSHVAYQNCRGVQNTGAKYALTQAYQRGYTTAQKAVAKSPCVYLVRDRARNN